jgi:hypothetical protein
VSGCYDGDSFLGSIDEDAVTLLWRRAGNLTQWRGA